MGSGLELSVLTGDCLIKPLYGSRLGTKALLSAGCLDISKKPQIPSDPRNVQASVCER
jgi:hypothetical protein